MKRSIWAPLAGVTLAAAVLMNASIQVGQKSGLYQDVPEKQVHFEKAAKVALDQASPLRRVTKLAAAEGLIFVLDRDQSRIFAFHPSGELRQTIGQPGQGPGDLERPSDFVVSDRQLHVLDSIKKQIDVFGLDGTFQSRLRLELPNEFSYCYPAELLSGPTHYYCSYVLCQHRVDRFDKTGRYVDTLLELDRPVRVPGKNLGNSSYLQWTSDGCLLHLDLFTGVFTKTKPGEGSAAIFGAFDEFHQNAIQKVDFERDRSEGPGLSVTTTGAWSRACQDEDGNIYALLLISENRNPMRDLFVFSPDGALLYRKGIPPLDSSPVRDIYFGNGNFILVTEEDEIWTVEGGTTR